MGRDHQTSIIEHLPWMIFKYQVSADGAWSFPYASQKTHDLCGLDPKSLIDDAGPFHEIIPPEERTKFFRARKQSAATLTPLELIFKLEARWLRFSASPQKNPDGSITWFGMLQDCTMEQTTQEKLLRRMKLLALQGEINQMILHSNSKEDVFQKACEIAISIADFKLAWIGVKDPQSMTLVPVAMSGTEISYLSKMQAISVEDIPQGRGPSGRAFREEVTLINNDLESNPHYEPWLKDAIGHHFQSSIALPLRLNEKVVGTFNIYSLHKNFFQTEEVELLEEISRDISFAAEIFETRKVLKDTQLNFQNIFHSAPIGILLSDPTSGKIFEINDSYLSLLGYVREDFQLETWMDFTHPDDIAMDMHNAELLKNHRVQSIKKTKRYVKKNGEVIWVDVYAVPFHHAELDRPLNLVMAQDISERIKYETELQNSIELKDEFITMASHELKTPTTSLKLQMQILERELKHSDDVGEFKKKCGKRISTSIYLLTHLNELINRLLDVSKLRSGSFKLNLEEADVSEMLKDELHKFRTSFDIRKCSLKLDCQEHIRAFIDEEKIRQVVAAIIDNVLRYAPGSLVEMKLSASANEVMLFVKDYGRGIAPEKLAKIFNKFERLDADRNLGGFGLGLYVAKKIVDAHMGTIEIKSNIGKGTEIRVRLPVEQGSRPQAGENHDK